MYTWLQIYPKNEAIYNRPLYFDFLIHLNVHVLQISLEGTRFLSFEDLKCLNKEKLFRIIAFA